MRRFLILALVLAMNNCGGNDDDESRTRQDGWTELRLKVGVDGCTKSILDPNPYDGDYTDASGKTCLTFSLVATVDVHTAREYCKCVYDEVSYRYTYQDTMDYSCTVVETLENDGVYDQCYDKVKPK